MKGKRKERDVERQKRFKSNEARTIVIRASKKLAMTLLEIKKENAFKVLGS